MYVEKNILLFFIKSANNSKKSCIFALPKMKTEVSVAQQVEHIPFKDGVLGSNPSWNTINYS